MTDSGGNQHGNHSFPSRRPAVLHQDEGSRLDGCVVQTRSQALFKQTESQDEIDIFEKTQLASRLLKRPTSP